MRRLAAFLCLALVVGAAAGGLAWRTFLQPGPLASPTTLIIPWGADLATISRALEAAGVIDSELVFIAGTRVTGLAGRLRAGEFAFVPRMAMRDVAVHIAKGRTVQRRLTIVEGLTTAEIVAAVRSADGLRGDTEKEFREGALLPETYFFSHGDTRMSVLSRMAAAMDKALADAWRRRGDDIALRSSREALILASIIEKETGKAAERARVSAVFHNRLRRRMPLQSDPTVAYAITGGRQPLGRALTRKDLKFVSPYNTYLRRGLPAGPIANPGRAAIEAAVRPLSTDELYFVADGEGGHRFVRTLEEHNRNVAKLRRALRKKAREKADQ